MEQRVIISRLLDKYENSKHLLQPGVSSRRVMLRIDSNELPEYKYDEGSAIRDAYNQAAIALEKEGLISIEWARSGRMSIISLNLHAIDEAYCLSKRQHPRDKANAVIATIERELPEVSCSWIGVWMQETCETARQTYKIPGYCKDSLSFLEKLVTAFGFYDRFNGSPVSMRAFSIACYHDSKVFEHECRDEFLRIAKKYNQDLHETCLQRDLSQRDELAFLGIYARPELYEVSGRCNIETTSGVIDLSPAGKFGLGIPGTMVDSIVRFNLASTRKITFIENKTNYDEYLLSEKAEDEIVLYHGGFLSPQKRKLYEKIALAVQEGIEVSFWADIDLGGFKMFDKLQAIFSQLIPKKMGAEDVEKFHSKGKKRQEDYLAQLEAYRNEKNNSVFLDAIDQILKYRVTIEQEVFLME